MENAAPLFGPGPDGAISAPGSCGLTWRRGRRPVVGSGRCAPGVAAARPQLDSSVRRQLASFFRSLVTSPLRWQRVLPLVLLTLPGCELPFAPGGCTASVEPGVVVEIRDARSGAPLAGLAAGVVRDGAYVDSLRPAAFSDPSDPVGSMTSRQAAPERPGRYAVEVQRAGYQPWTRTGVRVGRGACHVETARLRADLEPLPQP